jgi:hypothetical protein
VVAGASGAAYYVAYQDGLAAVSDTQAQLLLADPTVAAAYPNSTPQPLSMTAAQAAAAPQATEHPTVLPPQPPHLAEATSGMAELCADYGIPSGVAPPAPTVTTTTAAPITMPATVPVDTTGGPVADAVTVSAGAGAVVRVLPGPGVTGGTTYLITDVGTKFPIGTAPSGEHRVPVRGPAGQQEH